MTQEGGELPLQVASDIKSMCARLSTVFSTFRVVEFKNAVLTYIQGCDPKWSGYRMAFCFIVEGDAEVSVYV